MRRTVRLATVVIAVAVLAESSRGPGVANAASSTVAAQAPAVSSAPSDACSLLTKPDAAAALGEAVSGPRSSSTRSVVPGATASSCEYSAGLRRVHLNLWRSSPGGVAQFQQIYRAACAKKAKDGLSGLGDVACWYSDRHEELQVLRGGVFVSVQLRRQGDPTEAIKTVAKSALDRLR
jgi:hypothetical protein